MSRMKDPSITAYMEGHSVYNRLINGMVLFMDILITVFVVFGFLSIIHQIYSVYILPLFSISMIYPSFIIHIKLFISIFVLYSVRKIFIVTRKKHPFSLENIKYTRYIGIAILLLALDKFRMILMVFQPHIVNKSHGFTYLHTFIIYFILGLSLLALSRIFTIGLELKSEQDLTV